MPSVSQAQQRFMGMDYERAKEGKKTRTGMSASQLRDFAATPRKGLPERKGKSKVIAHMMGRKK